MNESSTTKDDPSLETSRPEFGRDQAETTDGVSALLSIGRQVIQKGPTPGRACQAAPVQVIRQIRSRLLGQARQRLGLLDANRM
jgi:hypothetical protein